MSQTETIQLVTTQPFKALAVRTTMTADKEGTRRAWRALTELLPLSDPRIEDPATGYVFIPQSEWATRVQTLWVGLAVIEYGEVPEGVERIDIPGSLCVRVQVKGDEKQMIRSYDELFSWLKHNGEYELDTNEGVWGLEANRLVPVNPLTIPYQEIKLFDYDMLYPVRKRSGI